MNSKCPAVSVVIPTFNGANYIVDTINSVIAQTYRDLEIVVVDDGSTDHTVEALGEINDPRLRIISKKNGGIASARNHGLRHCHGEFVAFLDHDDIWHHDKLAIQLEIIRSHSDVSVVYSEFERWDGGGDLPFWQRKKTTDISNELSGWIYHKLLLTNYVLMSTAVFRMSAVQQVGEFDEHLTISDDWDFVVRLSRVGKFLKVRDSLTLYRVHPNQTSRKINSIDFESDFRLRAIGKYGLAGPDGSCVDKSALRFRFFRSYFCHAYMHYRAGTPEVAIRYFWRSIVARPIAIRPYLLLAASILKWASTLIKCKLGP